MGVVKSSFWGSEVGGGVMVQLKKNFRKRSTTFLVLRLHSGKLQLETPLNGEAHNLLE